MLFYYCPIMGFLGWKIVLLEIKENPSQRNNSLRMTQNSFGKKRLYSRKILFR